MDQAAQAFEIRGKSNRIESRPVSPEAIPSSRRGDDGSGQFVVGKFTIAGKLDMRYAPLPGGIEGINENGRSDTREGRHTGEQ